jgi:hypothetical protein
MTTEIFSGRAEALKDRVDAIITGGATSVQVVALSQSSTYLIIYS